jgi:hypothetical protein
MVAVARTVGFPLLRYGIEIDALAKPHRAGIITNLVPNQPRGV